jgi:hypothetical protein
MAEKIVRQYSGCEVTIVFKENNPEIKEKVLALLLENYQTRISDTLKSEYKNLLEEKKAS